MSKENKKIKKEETTKGPENCPEEESVETAESNREEEGQGRRKRRKIRQRRRLRKVRLRRLKRSWPQTQGSTDTVIGGF